LISSCSLNIYTFRKKTGNPGIAGTKNQQAQVKKKGRDWFSCLH
jgi:hypothetical protein